MMDWEECNDKKLVKNIKPDKNLIKSLRISSEKKLKSANLLALNETTAASVFSLSYESLREMLEALAVENGLKVYNHDCFCAFLNEILKKDELATRFDRFRRIRNGINYYGKDISVEEANALKKEIKEFIAEIGKSFTKF